MALVDTGLVHEALEAPEEVRRGAFAAADDAAAALDWETPMSEVALRAVETKSSATKFKLG